jgi:oligosaccharide repeat unit polymerase
MVIAIVQIIAMRGFPLLWIVTGDDRSYRDFGFLSINGLINSMVLACAISGVYCWLVSSNKKYLLPLVVVFIYSSLIFNRQMLFSIVFEAVVLYLIQRPVGVKIIARIALLFVFLISLNGVIGQYRTGHEELKELFQVRYEYSEIPGSIMWMYAYVATPLNNLINTIYSSDPAWNSLFYNTVSTLFPSVVRGELFADVNLLSANLYSGAFTVSTAFVDPYLDYGSLGMALYGVLFGFVAQLAWFYPTPRSRLMYCVLAQAVILSIFTNFLFYLPSIFQLFWLHLIGSKYHPEAVASDKSSETSPPEPEAAQPAKTPA